MRFDSASQFEILEDSNGYITAQGIIATAGEQLQYGNQTETISENALFGNMDEWEGLPVTLQHPRGLLNPSNTQAHQVGSVIKVERRGDALWAKFKVTSKKAVDAVKSGLRGLSAGYRATLDGATQIARSNNHLALCNVGRSPSSGIRRDSNDLGDGQMASIKFPDGTEVKLDCSDAEATLLQNGVNALAERADSARDDHDELYDFIMKLDSDDTEMSIQEKMKKLKKDMENAGEDKKKISKLKAEYDALVEKDKKSNEKMDSADVMSMLETVKKCEKLHPKLEVKNDSGEFKSLNEMIVESLKSKDENIKLDGYEEDCSYLAARLDAAIEMSDAFSARGNQKPQPKTQNTVSAQERADSKFYGQE